MRQAQLGHGLDHQSVARSRFVSCDQPTAQFLDRDPDVHEPHNRAVSEDPIPLILTLL